MALLKGHRANFNTLRLITFLIVVAIYIAAAGYIGGHVFNIEGCE